MLIKLLRMTESEHDGETLNAVRMANALLNRHNANWDEVLRGKVPMIDADPFGTSPKMGKIPDKGAHYTNAAEIDAMFANIYNRLRPTDAFKVYVDSVHEWWEQKGFLTQKQYDVIKRSAGRR
jgi:hypothetical protein